MVNKVLAVIPARGGSKRIPKKNILEFQGKPMIAWTIEAAQKSNIFTDIVVSTDDREIAAIAEEYGASVPFFRDKYADDHTPISMVTVDALEKLGNDYDIVVQLMANCPLRDAEDIRNAFHTFQTQKFNFQISCFQYGFMNPWWAYALKKDYKPEPLFEANIREKRSQDQEDLYCPTGAIWIARVPRLLDSKTFYGEGFRMVPMDWKKALDIDNQEDLELTKAVFQLIKNDQN
jgi:N-acylneuraminate cytidylyltransferase